MGDEGLELSPEKSPQETVNNAVTSNASKSTNGPRVHDRVHEPEFPPELLLIIEHWESIPDYMKETIMSLIKSHIMQSKDGAKGLNQ